MFDKNQRQDQQQKIDIAYEKHGIVSEFNCPYYSDERAEFFERERVCSSGTEAIKNKELYFKSKMVKCVVYEGKVKKVFCHHLDTSSKRCNSPLIKPEESKNCHIVD